MRSTTNLLYLSMTTGLLAMGWYVVRDASGAASGSARAPATTREMLVHPPKPENPIGEVLAKLEAAGTWEPRQTDARAELANRLALSSVAIHDTREEVIEQLGEPGFRSADDNRWTYVDRVIVFHDDHVAGVVELDERAAELHRVAAVRGSLHPEEPEIQMAGRFIDVEPNRASRGYDEQYRSFSIYDRLYRTRSQRNRSFQRPDFLRAFARTLSRNDRRNRDTASQRYRAATR